MKKIGSFFACAFFCTFTLPGDFIYYNYTLNTNLPGTNLNSIYKTFHTAYATFQPPHDVFATSTHPISTNPPWERGHYFGTHTETPRGTGHKLVGMHFARKTSCNTFWKK